MIRNTKKLINKNIDLRKSTQYVTAARTIINNNFNKIKRDMIAEFNNHPVTREIEMGKYADNISRTLTGKGNLFTFIGFDSGSKPTQVIRNLLDDKTFINAVNVRKDGTINNVIAHPSPADIFEVTPLPWAEGRSWAEGIERGISNLGFFLNVKSEKSRSGQGIQAEHKVSDISFEPRAYITSIIRNFERKILGLNKITIQ